MAGITVIQPNSATQDAATYKQAIELAIAELMKAYAAASRRLGVHADELPAMWMLGGLAFLDKLPEELLAGALAETGTAGSSYTLDFLSRHGRVFSLSLTANCTFTIANPPPSGRVATVLLILTQDGTGGRTVIWPPVVKWSGGVQPTADTAAGRVNIYSLFTVDGGATWHGSLVSAGSR